MNPTRFQRDTYYYRELHVFSSRLSAKTQEGTLITNQTYYGKTEHGTKYLNWDQNFDIYLFIYLFF